MGAVACQNSRRSQSGRQMRLRAKGMPALRGGGRATCSSSWLLRLPSTDSKQKELLREFEELIEENNPESQSFFQVGQKLLGFDEGLIGPVRIRYT